MQTIDPPPALTLMLGLSGLPGRDAFAVDPMSLGAGQLVILEPLPERAAAIEVAWRDRSGVRVQAAALGEAGPGRAELILYAAHGLRSLRPAVPGLDATERRVVEVLSPDAVAAALPRLEGALHLVLDCGGEEMALFSALDRAGLLERVTRVQMRAARRAVFRGAAPAAVLQERLQAAGIFLHDSDVGRPGWPVLSLRRDPRIAELVEIAAERDGLRAALAELETRHDRARRQADGAIRARKAADLHRAETEDALELVRADLRDLQARLAAAENAAGRQAALLRELEDLVQEICDGTGAAE